MTMPPQDLHPAPLSELSAWRIADPRERLSALRELRDKGAVVHLCGDGGARVMGTLHAVDKDRGRLTFTGDATADGWRAIDGRARVDALAFPGSARLQMDLPHPQVIGEGPELRLDTGMPTAIYRIQRRHAFRVRTLERESPSAYFRHPEAPHPMLTLRVLDLSVGGCALRVPIGTVATFARGMRLPGVSFTLDPQTAFACEVVVHHVNPTPLGQRLGCEMLGLDGSIERQLQRCVDQMQKRQRWAEALI
jgi:c-di-GMP-binding flagellar brake protein YcgR